MERPLASPKRAASTAPSAPPRRRQQIWIVLPAYNEEASLPALLEAIDESMFEAGLSYRVLVMDDGSDDRTPAIATEAATRLPVVVRRHERNLGLGATIRDGLVAAVELAEAKDILVTMDADNTHTPELILRMVRLVREGHDVVIASRYRTGSRIRGVPWFRRALSYWGSWLFRVLFPTPGVRDYTCGYRAYRAAVLQAVVAEEGRDFFEQSGFQCMVDILLKLRAGKGPRELIFGEVPLVLRYDLKEGASKMRVWKTVRDTLALVVRRRFGR
jgi:dolichol-phosphate mannosyltransferase